MMDPAVFTTVCRADDQAPPT